MLPNTTDCDNLVGVRRLALFLRYRCGSASGDEMVPAVLLAAVLKRALIAQAHILRVEYRYSH
jgi:hypothetical protein